MEVITSKESRTFKELSRLTQKKYRDRLSKFIAEGPNVIGEAVTQFPDLVDSVFAMEGSGYESFTSGTVVLSEQLFARITDTVTSQGLIAVIGKPDRGDARDAFSSFAEEGNVVVLDRLQDPGNIGTIVRTAEGAGISAIAIIKGTCDPFSPKVVRACAGSVLRVPLLFFDSAEELISAAKEMKIRLAVTDVKSGTPYYSLSKAEHKNKTALVIGNEGNGVSQEFLDSADIRVNIPMAGKLESLNASVAAALLMYEMERPDEK